MNLALADAYICLSLSSVYLDMISTLGVMHIQGTYFSPPPPKGKERKN